MHTIVIMIIVDDADDGVSIDSRFHSHSPICNEVEPYCSCFCVSLSMKLKCICNMHRRHRRRPYTLSLLGTYYYYYAHCALHKSIRIRESFTFCVCNKTKATERKYIRNKLENLFGWKLLPLSLLLRRIHWTYSRLWKLYFAREHKSSLLQRCAALST